MASPNLLSGTVMDAVASLMNDTAKATYTYVVQIPYLNMALLELQEIFELNEIPVTATVSTAVTVPVGTTSIAFPPAVPIGGTPYLPSDMIEPQVLWERPVNSNPYIRMTKVEVLPRYLEGIDLTQFSWFTWQSQQIRVLAANLPIQIKMDYIRNLFATVTTSTDELYIINGQSFLQFRTAALCSYFIGENEMRANELDGFSGPAVDRAIGIGTKGRQGITTRRRPFRSSWKRRSYV